MNHEKGKPSNGKRKTIPDEGNNKAAGKMKQPKRQRNRQKAQSKIHSNEHLVVSSEIVPLATEYTVPGSPSLIRIVEPYPYSFCSHAKARWCGRTILDVYATEFGSFPQSYYEVAIDQGRILVNDQAVSCDYVIKGGDRLCHTVHRHEPAVAVSSTVAPHVTVVAEDERLVVVDKPCTMPVHPCGGYHQNSLINILEPCYGKLFTIYRLDRLTSGLLILAKSTETAREWGNAIKQRDSCSKLYLARVRGKFPSNIPPQLPKLTETNNGFPPVHGEWTSRPEGAPDEEWSRARNCYGYYFVNGNSEAINPTIIEYQLNQGSKGAQYLASIDKFENDAGPTMSPDLQWLRLCCPVRVQNHKNGVCNAGLFDELDPDCYSKSVKAAETSFALLHYDPVSDSSVVLCQPITGRTHQIRLHLQALGHPIANDPNYGGEIWFQNRQASEECNKARSLLESMDTESLTVDAKKCLLVADEPATITEVREIVSATEKRESETIHDFIRRTCVWCSRIHGTRHRNQQEFLVRSRGIWLHAFQYSMLREEGGQRLTFKTKVPQWAKCHQDIHKN